MQIWDIKFLEILLLNKPQICIIKINKVTEVQEKKFPHKEFEFNLMNKFTILMIKNWGEIITPLCHDKDLDT